jgi:lipoic acid synthetase
MTGPFKKKRIKLADVIAFKKTLRQAGLHTVCESARCPNIGECFCKKTATFLIAGDTCTRQCRFCAIAKGTPLPLDPGEPERVAATARSLGLRYVVITSVTRDDLPDGGAVHFAHTLSRLRSALPTARLEVLVPDFAGKEDSAAVVFDAAPDVFAHNLETVPRLYPRARAGADYRRSLELLSRAKGRGLLTKSGVMLGLGENDTEVTAVMDDLRCAGCDILTIGQYLAPTADALPVHAFVPPERFAALRDAALARGFRACASGSYVRSSYRAETMLPD